METRVPADEGPWPAARPLEHGDDALIARLAAIEARLDGLEASVREAMAQELQGTVDELRRAVSDLGRLLLRDLDRLTKVLADHRDAIVERLNPPGPPVPAEAPAGAPPEDQDPGDAEPVPLTGEEGRWRALPGRRKGRRSPKSRAGGNTCDG